MSEGDIDLLPPSGGGETKTQNITIYNYIELVNQTSTLPDGAALNSYSSEDKAWIKERVNFEQEQRLALINKLIDHKHAADTAAQDYAHRGMIQRQYGAITLIIIALLAAAILIARGCGWVALGLPGVLLIPGLAAALTGGFTDRIKEAMTTTKPSTPPVSSK